jgi:hypothetical protein
VPGTKRAKARIVAVVVGIGAVATLLVCWLVWSSRPQQMGADPDVFATVDALFTAVTARDETRLGQCEQRLHVLRDAGKLPRTAADHLDGIIGKARRGRWESAAEQLYAFMKSQRRDGQRRPGQGGLRHRRTADG